MLDGPPEPNAHSGEEAGVASKLRKDADGSGTGDTPEDVAALFRWLDVKDFPYRDFSAARRALTARQRQSAARGQRQRAARSVRNAARLAIEAERNARQASEEATQQSAELRRALDRHQTEQARVAQDARDRLRAQAEDHRRQAAMQRMWSTQGSEALRRATQAERAATDEVTDTVARLRGDPSELAKEASATQLPQQVNATAGEQRGSRRSTETLTFTMEMRPATSTDDDDMLPSRIPARRSLPAFSSESPGAAKQTSFDGEAPARNAWGPPATSASTPRTGVAAQDGEADNRSAAPLSGASPGGMPSWIETSPNPCKEGQRQRPEISAETLKTTRERVAARWFTVRGIFGAQLEEKLGAQAQTRDVLPPSLALFSMAGGVGKTSLAAALTRALAAQGERVLLVDMTPHEILPFFFGAEEFRPGSRRVFAPPPGTPDAPIHLVDYGPGSVESNAPDGLGQRLQRDSKGFSRIVLDTSAADVGNLRDLSLLGGVVLVPLLPDMNSLLSLRAMRRALSLSGEPSGTEAHPWYLLTQFDASQPLHLDVREMLEGELGDQLLPFVVRHSAAVAEALAQGMTVIDYAPGEGIAKDLQQVTAWVRTLIEPAREGLGQARWSER